MTAEQFIQLYGPYIAVGFAALLIIIWLVMRANRTTSVKISKDVLDEGAAPAARNQALIDAPAKTVPPVETSEKQPVKTGSKGADDLTQIKGLGPKLAAMLTDMGINQISQIAAWDESEIARIDAQLGRFSGRIERDNWVEQARHLSGGDADSFADKFGNNG